MGCQLHCGEGQNERVKREHEKQRTTRTDVTKGISTDNLKEWLHIHRRVAVKDAR